MRHFVEFGCTAVVLAFDDKRHVPKAKAITQLKRRVGVQLLDFSEADVLPTVLPAEWKEAIMSPWFKHRVIELICTNVPRLVAPPDGCRLIIDWETVTEYTYHSRREEDCGSSEESSSDRGLARVAHLPQDSDIGEADLKFTRWMRALCCPMLVEATDGDYIPISLGLRAAGYLHPITILKAWTIERGSEFISMDRIYAFLCDRMAVACRRTGRHPDCPDWEVRAADLRARRASCSRRPGLGTDQALHHHPRPLRHGLHAQPAPHQPPEDLGRPAPGRPDLSDGGPGAHPYGPGQAHHRAAVRGGLSEAHRHFLEEECLEPGSGDSAGRFALCVLHGHADGIGSQASKLGQRNKALIPTDARIACTLRNLNFLLAYWLEFQAPDPVQDFGFRLDDRGAVVAWDD